MPTVPDREHYLFSRPKSLPLQEVSFSFYDLKHFIAADSFLLSQEVEKLSSLLVPPGEERATECAKPNEWTRTQKLKISY